jgi:mannose-1-phosphate guanylyltransferase
MNHTYAVIMAGGGGTRLWPISRREHPKHVLPLIGMRTLFQNTLDRLAGFISPEHIFIVTTAEQEQVLKSQVPELPAVNYLVEPAPRGTASVVGLAATILLKSDPDAQMIVLPSDHFIRNIDQFHSIMRIALQVAAKGYLVTLGITPTFPATGYGYIQRGNDLAEKFDHPVFRMKQFKEKPDEAKARAMLASGDYSWNSGMFVWRADCILDEFSRQMPDLKAAFDRIGETWGSPEQGTCLKSEWLPLKSETIDYAIMEHARNAAVLPAGGLEWSDVGSWDSLFEVLVPDGDGNVVINGVHMPFDTHDTLVYSVGKKLVVTIGVDDLILVDTEDALLVCRRGQTQEVRMIIEHLKNSNREEYL